MKNTTTQQRTAPRECCSDVNCECGLRNNYFEGKRLTANSFRVEQKYMIGRRHLLNRAIHGWGVVYGYKITSGAPNTPVGPGKLKIGPGLALDVCGRELVQTERPIAVSEVIVRDENDKPVDLDTLSQEDCEQRCWLLSVHYAEQPIDHIRVEDPCRCEHDEWDHMCETVRYSLRPIPCEECCQPFDCELECDCGIGPCCDEPTETDYNTDYKRRYETAYSADYEEAYQADYKTGYETEHPPTTKKHQRGGCRCLCEHLTNLPIPDCCSLCEIEEPCGNVWVDLKNGVPLACVDLVRDECDRWMFGDVEACGPRRLVKRNDLLFDLIQGCDLTRMIDFGWKQWHRNRYPVPFDEFSRAFGGGAGQNQYVAHDFWVMFSRPVREDTVRADCFAMTVLTSEREGGWWQTFRVPIVGVYTADFPPEQGDPPHHVRGAKIIVDGPWLDDAVRGRRTIFLGGETRVEFEVRGDFMIDCNGQQLDLNADGLSPSPTGNNTPGGTFLSTFVVAAAIEIRTRPAPYGSGDPKGVAS